MAIRIELRRVEKMGSTIFRLFTLPRCVLAHWTERGTELCEGEANCKKHIRPMLKGFSCAYEWVESSSAWLPVAMEWTESMIQFIGLEFQPGDVWELKRKGTGKTPREVIGQHLGCIPLAPGTKPWDVQAVVETYFRNKKVHWDISPDYRPNIVAQEDRSERPSCLPDSVKADIPVANPEEILAFKERLKKARQEVARNVN